MRVRSSPGSESALNLLSQVYCVHRQSQMLLSAQFHISFNSFPQNNEIESGEREPGELP